MKKSKWIKSNRHKLNCQSKAEIIMAQILRKSLIAYERNYPVDLHNGCVRFLDFYLPTNDIAIEIDGKEHDEFDDEIREREIKNVFPCRFIRFKNRDLYSRQEQVQKIILSEAPNRLLPEQRKLTGSERKKIFREKRETPEEYNIRHLEKEHNAHLKAIFAGRA